MAPPPGFEPGSEPRQGSMIGHYTTGAGRASDIGPVFNRYSFRRLGADMADDVVDEDTGTDEMLEKGWVEEVKTLLEKQTQTGKVYPALDSIGYRQIQAYLNGELTQDKMRDEIIIRTRQFARRQTQWFKKETIDLIIEMDNMDRKKLPEILYCIFNTLA